MDAMQLARGETARTAVPRPPSARLADTQWWYAPVVMALAVFLVAILYVHPPIDGYLSQAMLRRDVLPDDAPHSAFTAPHNTDDLNRWLHSETTLAHIAQQAGLVRDDSGSPSDTTAPRIERLREHLDIAHTTDGEVQQWSVRYLGRDRLESRRIAEVAAEALASYLDRLHDNRPTEAELAALRHQIHSARDEEDRLLREIEGLRHEQLTLTLLRAQQRDSAGSGAAVSVDPAAPMQPGGNHDQLAEDLARLRIERGILAANRQPTHPQIVALDAQIAQLEKQLRQASGPLLEDPGRSADAETASPLDNSPLRAYFASNRSAIGDEPLDPAINIAARIEDAAMALRTLATERKEAERRLDAALRIAAQPWRKQWMVAGTVPARRVGGTPRPHDVVWAGWMAGLAALAMALSWNWTRSRAIGDSDDARNKLGLPLLGEIHLPSASPAMPRRNSSSAQRLVLSAGEWFLMLALVTFLLAALSSRAVGAELFHDPLGALVEAVDSIRGAIS